MPDYTPLTAAPMLGASDPRTRIAMTMLQSGNDYSPVRSWTQGAARVANALLGGMMMRQSQEDSRSALSGLVDALSGSQGTTAPAPAQSEAAPPAPAVPPAAMSGTPMADNAPAMSGGIMTADNSATTGPRGFRNNNPLNIEAGSFTQSQPGFQGSDGRFAKFGAMDQGVGAADTLLQSYANRGINTVAGIVNRWSPPSDNNPTNAYAATVAKNIGVDANQPLDMSNPALRQKIIGAMAQFENGKPLQMASAAPQSMTDASPMGAGPMGFAPQQQTANPLSSGSGFAPQTDAQPPNVTNVPVKQAQAQPPQSPQMKPILAPPAAAQPTMPANVKAAISAALASDNPQAQAMAAAMLQKYTQPVEYGFQTLPDGTMVRTNKQTGSVEPISQTTKPQFNANAGRDPYGNPIPGFVDATNQSVHLIGPTGQVGNQPGQPQPQAQANPDVHGEEFLKTVDPQKAEIVKGIAEGRIPYPSGFIMKTPYGQWLTQAVSQYKPGLTAQDFNTIAATRKNYTSGPSFQEIKAINTAIGHASKMWGVSDQLGGSDVMPGYVNPIVQGVKNNFPAINPNFQTAKKEYDALSETLSTEVSKALNGGVPHVADKEHWRQIFANADGPTQRKAAISASMAILEGRTTPLKQGYEQGMKSAGEPLNVISPENQQRFERLLHGQSPTEGPAQQQAPASGPKPGEVQQGYRFKGGNPADQNAWEKVQ